MTPLVQARLGAAVEALRAAGALWLPQRLDDAIARRDRDHVDHLLRHAREWLSLPPIPSEEPRFAANKATARDAVGLLWAVVEEV